MIEKYREEILNYLFSIESFSKAWENSWKNKINQIVGKELTLEKLFKIGEEARNIFMSTRENGRSQGTVSSAGTSWESFLAWYLNLGLVGTRTIVLKPKKELNFECVQKVIAINYGNFTSSSETDLIAITFPKKEDLAYHVQDLIRFEGKIFNIRELEEPKEVDIEFINNYLNRIIENNITKIKINVIQCKTNWNDNAQIPMGWDMIYSSTGFLAKDISIGRDGFSIHKTSEFKYSFVTVPTQKDLDSFKKNSTAVKRVRNLSGKNFWGVVSKENVAQSIGEIFMENFSESFNEKKFKERIEKNNINIFKLL